MLIALVCGSTLAAAAESVALERDSQLRAAPAGDAAVVAELKSGTSLELLGRKGAWVNVKSAAGTGWVLSFNVRFGGAQAGASGSSGGSSFNPFAARSRPATTATIGIRGLEAEDLRTSRVDVRQVQLLDKYAASKEQAEAAAQASGLSATAVEYFTP